MTWIEWLYAHIERPELILLIFPLILIIWYVLHKDYIQLKEDPEITQQKKRVRRFMNISRPFITLLLLIALAAPYTQTERTIDGDPFITLITDNSTSMSLFENPADKLAAALEKKLPVERKSIGSAERSDLGDGILAHLQPSQSILLLTDGNNNEGANLGDVALYATRLNTTINAITLNPLHDDLAITVSGPSKTMEDVENTFTLHLQHVGQKKARHVTVTVDDKVVIDTTTTDTTIPFTSTLGGGYHKIIAKTDTPDFFPQNNIHYKTVKVVPKPPVLFWGEGPSPFLTLISDLYDVTPLTTPPQDLSDYYAIVVNNRNRIHVDAHFDKLNNYINEGNGIVVVGGKDSYDRGEYKNSLFETMLPVIVGTPERKEGDINIVIVIDISGSTGSAYGEGKAVDVEKALAIGVLKDLDAKHNLGVIAFNTAAYLISDTSPVFEKVKLDEKIASLRDGGGTLISAGLLKAIAMLDPLSGSKNIVLISDGKTQAGAVTEEVAKAASNSGMRIFTVGVGPQTNEELMQRIADITNGVYFRATDRSRLKLLFGKPEDTPPQGGTLSMTILNSNHFITENLELNAKIHGYNAVSPKTTARLLITTSTGEPILTIGRLGLGRIAAYSTDDGTAWSGEALNKQNSRIITRMMNWAIGEPDRKSKEYIEAHDTRQNEPTEIIIKSPTAPPQAEDVVFYKIDHDLYSTTVTPTEPGFQTVAGALFAVNTPREYETVGENEELKNIITSTGGRFFNPTDIDSIVEHAKSNARRTINTKYYIIWPFILLAILLYLTEIFIRRLLRRD